MLFDVTKTGRLNSDTISGLAVCKGSCNGALQQIEHTDDFDSLATLELLLNKPP